MFTKEILDDLGGIFAAVCRDFESEFVEFDGEDDHVHLLVNYPPKVAISSLVNSLKGVSSRLIGQRRFPTIRKKLWGGALWSPSYSAGSCGGAPIEIVAPIHRATTNSALDAATDAFGVRAILPRPEGRGLPRIPINNAASASTENC